MQSDTPEADAKRTQSDGPSQRSSAPIPDDATITQATAYGEAPDRNIAQSLSQNGLSQPDSLATESGEESEPTGFAAQAFASTPPQEKLASIDAEMQKSMAADDVYYLIDADWYQRWKRAMTGEEDKTGPVEEKDLAAVTAQSIVDPSTGKLRQPLFEHEDVEFITPAAYAQFVQWYGVPDPVPPTRKVILRGERQEPALELYPPSITVSTMSKMSSVSARPPHQLPVSTTTTVHDLLAAAAKQVSETDPSPTSYRVWLLGSVPAGKKVYVEFPGPSISNYDAKVMEPSDRTVEDEGLKEAHLVVEFKEGNSWIVKDDEDDNEPGMFSRGGFFDKFSTQSSSSSVMKPRPTSSSSFRMSSASTSKISREPGTIGLGNLGNTCFMNSALQCLAHQEELTEYFMSGVYKQELNPDNPLGMHGAIAEAFGELLQQIWARTSGSSHSPRDFKMQLQRFAPQFSGYQQHDSQELVAFLLDGLHEDLNRVLKKPYVEKPDWDGGADLELAQLAKKSWDGYMLRNDSVIVDLFQGQYQSTLVCPQCQKVSITFDPFMYLTLPLPIQSKWKHVIIYVPYESEKPHLRIPFEISSNSTFRDVRATVGRWMGVPAENLLTMEIFNSKFYRSLDDNTLVTEMNTSDLVICYELPCKGPQGRNYKHEEGAPFVLPLTLYCSNMRARPEFGYPMPIAISADDAKSVDAVYSVVVDRLQRWTKNSRDLYSWELGTDGEGGFEVPLQLGGGPDKIAEITATEGEVIVREEPIEEEEFDIVDEKKMLVDDTYDPAASPVKVGPKKDVFTLRFAPDRTNFGIGYVSLGQIDTLEARANEEGAPLLHPDDGLYLEFDQNMREYFFSDGCVTWDELQEFSHPEIDAAREEEEKPRGPITLQDCLDEFTKEEQLGEDDLWYCPQCKKHQQATKRFDLWKTPDILVVHLKRFSNSRALRDKIDAFIDFPLEGLDLAGMSGERKVAQKLKEQGVDTAELDLGNTEEPLLYDLFAVDEHLGGLGGGHYRAYALNHQTHKWYHFDDSFVTPAEAKDAVNANAYLLFYRKRTDKPLGGKTHTKIEEARSNATDDVQPEDDTMNVDTQLPTPPEDDSPFFERASDLPSFDPDRARWRPISPMHTPDWENSSNPPALLDDPPDFSSHMMDPLVTAGRYTMPDPENVGGPISPSSSTGVEHDSDEAGAVLEDIDDDIWSQDRGMVPFRSTSPTASIELTGSPSSGSVSDNPFADANRQHGDHD